MRGGTMSKVRLTTDRIIEWVAEHFISSGEWCDAKTIAKGLDVSTAVIRNRMSKEGGCPSGLDVREEWRTSYSKDYPMMEAGAHKANVYAPTRQLLRVMVHDARKEVTS
jgi:hypothetical protein